MTSIKVMFRPSEKPGAEGNLCYRIIHERTIRRISTLYRLFPVEWDDVRSQPVRVSPVGASRQIVLERIRRSIGFDTERLERIISRMKVSGSYFSVDDVVDEFRSYAARYSLFNMMKCLIARFRTTGHFRTAETYTSALSNFCRFRKGADILIDCITSETIEAYQAWNASRDLVPNTISFYNRILRAVYRRAVRLNATPDRKPFANVYTGVEKTSKRSLPISDLRRIVAMDLSSDPQLDFARDIFLLSFYCRGMSFVDMVFLRRRDLRNGYITYRRRKTGQRLMIRWTKEMQRIVNKYPPGHNEYLLPIMKCSEGTDFTEYRNKSYILNRNLRKIGRMAGLSIPLTLYVARHSWASIARAKGIPVAVISEGMGHTSEATTRIYLASLDLSTVDRANATVISVLK